MLYVKAYTLMTSMKYMFSQRTYRILSQSSYTTRGFWIVNFFHKDYKYA